MFTYVVGDKYVTRGGDTVEVVQVHLVGAQVEIRMQRYDVDVYGDVTNSKIQNSTWGISHAVAASVPYVPPPDTQKFYTTSPVLGPIAWARIGSTVNVELQYSFVSNAFGGNMPTARELGISLLQQVTSFSALAFTNPIVSNHGPYVMFTANVGLWKKANGYSGVNSGIAINSLSFTPPSWDPIDNLTPYGQSIAETARLQCTCDFHALLREGCKCGAMEAERKKA